MKLASFLLPAIAGLVSASPPEAEAYILQSRPSQPGSAPSISSLVAQSILHQRLGLDQPLSDDLDEQDYHTIHRFGKTPQRLFADAASHGPHQLVVLVRNAESDNTKALKKAVASHGPAFTAPHLGRLPSSYLPQWTRKQCALEDALDIASRKCWTHGPVLYLEYDAANDQKDLKLLSQSIAKLQSAAEKMETAIILVPAGADELRRREFEIEHVFNEAADFAATGAAAAAASSSTSSPAKDQSFKPHPFVAAKGPIQACYTSLNACETATGGCSGHGECRNKFGKDAASACFSCHCQKTYGGVGGQSVWWWGGAACQKQDVSVPFWIFTGFTIFLVGAVGFSISLLFSVGEEKLPGVIGAGVSRGSK
ncbi:uncharacterized protein JN550_012072 [Neoarthrinium moseri]|uniref:uncharacterized protein n=1 Tax=Neoarthrinium moseri TaxID=1658444 RepID=UPI001FDB6EF8|nr:uncharacterized protein JN550_012072 [Neoarthrinium moseri]KAI1859263.1 hypothetical protein JN550_012072 [Neoarthrinium moseri]